MPGMTTETARRVAAAREQVLHTCALPGCGVEFLGVRQAKYHSQLCRQRAYMARPKRRGRPRKPAVAE